MRRVRGTDARRKRSHGLRGPERRRGGAARARNENTAAGAPGRLAGEFIVALALAPVAAHLATALLHGRDVDRSFAHHDDALRRSAETRFNRRRSRPGPPLDEPG